MPPSVRESFSVDAPSNVPLNEPRVMDQLLSDSFAQKLQALSQAHAGEYKANAPFPHIYFDDFLPAAVAEAALRDFPEPQQADWHAYTDVNQHKKLAFGAAEKLPASLRDVLYFLNSRPMLQFLETLTGIECVLPDPGFVGGGLHQIRPGGLLEVHADFSYHTALRLDRRINVLIYLNKDWKEEYGGHFELWDRELTGARSEFCPCSTVAPFSARRAYRFTGTRSRWPARPIAIENLWRHITTPTAVRKRIRNSPIVIR